MPIYFFYEDTDFILKDNNQLRHWIEEVVTNEGKRVEVLNYIFCSDEYLHQINTSYLNHDTYTDIITFDNSEEAGTIEGDIFISIARVRENAKNHNSSFERELHRVIVHGVLHLLGYKDKTASQQKAMREKEDYCLSLRAIGD